VKCVFCNEGCVYAFFHSSTGRKLLCWGFQGDVKCVFCRNGIEDRDHLFFSCGFSSRIWKHVMELCCVLNSPICWDDVVSLGCRSGGAKL
jgi:hypothetical protein